MRHGVQICRTQPTRSVAHHEGKFALAGDKQPGLLHDVFQILASHQWRVMVGLAAVVGVTISAMALVNNETFGDQFGISGLHRPRRLAGSVELGDCRNFRTGPGGGHMVGNGADTPTFGQRSDVLFVPRFG